MFALSTIFCLLVAVAGWYYAFYSTAAARLEGVESPPMNQMRVRLRRANGLMMFAMAVSLFLGTAALDLLWPSLAIVILWSAVIVLLVGIAILAMIDLRLTRRLRRDIHQKNNNAK